MRIQIMDLNRNMIYVRDGKGNRDLVTILTGVSNRDMRDQLKRVRQSHNKDLEKEYVSVNVLGVPEKSSVPKYSKTRRPKYMEKDNSLSMHKSL